MKSKILHTIQNWILQISKKIFNKKKNDNANYSVSSGEISIIVKPETGFG
jgi:hypothetical protein